jgi:hypothetical protein
MAVLLFLNDCSTRYHGRKSVSTGHFSHKTEAGSSAPAGRAATETVGATKSAQGVAETAPVW